MIDKIKLHFEELLRNGKTIPEIQDMLDEAIFEVQAELEEELRVKEAEEKLKIQKEKNAEAVGAVVQKFCEDWYPDLAQKLGNIDAANIIDTFDKLDSTMQLVFKFDSTGMIDPIEKFLKKYKLS
jgi:hypothetical protein